MKGPPSVGRLWEGRFWAPSVPDFEGGSGGPRAGSGARLAGASLGPRQVAPAPVPGGPPWSSLVFLLRERAVYRPFYLAWSEAQSSCPRGVV